MRLNKIISITQALRIPAPCVLCNHYHSDKKALCQYCSKLLVKIVHACSRCKALLPDSLFAYCGECIKTPPFFDAVFSAYVFKEPLRTLLHVFKYKTGLYLTGFMAELLLDAFSNVKSYKPDCLLAVPMHRERLRERGFNHALELCKIVSRRLKIPYDTGICEKIIHTAPQMGLDRGQRKSALKNAFVAKASPYKHIALIDDLLTTGSTANALAKVLKKQGVVRVDLCCIARTAQA